MKKITLLLLAVLSTFLSFSQGGDSMLFNKRNSENKYWLDFQLVQHVGLNKWSDDAFVSNGFPARSLTQLRGVFHLLLANPYIGFSADMGLGLMGAPKMGSFQFDGAPLPNKESTFYLREPITSIGNMSGPSLHFISSIGLFGKIKVNENAEVLPYFGVGFMTMPYRGYHVVLKEDGTNMMYDAVYEWNADGSSYDSPSTNPGFVDFRLNYAYSISPTSRVSVGIEYRYFFSTLDFVATTTNQFNQNLVRQTKVIGRNMNMLGLTVGLSLR